MSVTSRARRLRKQSTDSERALWRLLRNRELAGYKFRRQTPIGQYIVDFVCLAKKLVVEIDGGHHQEQSEYDDERTSSLEARGVLVLRFWNNQLLEETDSVLQAILVALEEESPST
ncbi:MAG: endonuclease domain-containing protein [Dehalococcoidia bacterium]|nr:endonuclease domain-containing protein [Dehalococcoidia bacterium]